MYKACAYADRTVMAAVLIFIALFLYAVPLLGIRPDPDTNLLGIDLDDLDLEDRAPCPCSSKDLCRPIKYDRDREASLDKPLMAWPLHEN